MFRQSVLYIALALLVVVFVIALGFLYLSGVGILYPKQLQIERQAVEQSKSFTDSHNMALTNMMLEYKTLDTQLTTTDDPELQSSIRKQQQAIVQTMCRMTATMAEGTVDPVIVGFLAQHGCSVY